jgi:RimJ/RimL family protein N-acetyltransferase
MILSRLRRENLAQVSRWFDDVETRKYVGGPDWPSQMLARDASEIGTVFRGERLLASHRWVASIDGRSVGYVDCGVTDCWNVCGAPEIAPEPVVLESIVGPAGSIVVVVAPEVRGRGVGQQMLRALLAEPAVREVRLFGAGIEADNVASRRCFEHAGFEAYDREPDWEGMIYYLLAPESDS